MLSLCLSVCLSVCEPIFSRTTRHRAKISSVAPSIHMLGTIQIWFISDNALGRNCKKNAINKVEKSASWELPCNSFLKIYINLSLMISASWVLACAEWVLASGVVTSLTSLNPDSQVQVLSRCQYAMRFNHCTGLTRASNDLKATTIF